MALIRYHTYWPSINDPYYQYNTTENNARNSYYGNDYTPHLFIDGNIDAGFNSGGWSNSFNNELNVVSPLDIQLTGDFNPITRRGHVIVTIIATDTIVNSSLRMRLAITEDSLYSGGLYHHQTFRDMVPSTSGRSFTIQNGDTVTFTENIYLPSQLNMNRCKIVVFVQSDSGRRILQGAKIRPRELPHIYQLTTFSLLSPPDDAEIPTCYPNTIWHRSNDTDSGFAVQYEVQIDDDSTFGSPLASGMISDTAWTCPVCLPNEMTYYWRVRASNGHAPDVWSTEVFSFTINYQYHISQFSLLEPYDGAIINSCYPHCAWGHSIDADSGYAVNYQVEMDTDPAFVNPYLSEFISDTTWNCPVCLPGDTTYYWRVKATNDHAPAIYSDQIFSFYIETPPACAYIPGDVNGNGSTNGLDVTYFTNYLKGGAAPLDTCQCANHGVMFVAADANGNCAVNGLDVTYMVNYFKGGPAILFCQDCPSEILIARNNKRFDNLRIKSN